MATGRERRRDQRWDLSIPLALFGKDKSNLLGHVVNVSDSGMLVLSVKQLHRQSQNKLWVQIPENDSAKRLLEVDAHAVWSEEDDDIGTFSTGFNLATNSSQLIDSARDLLDDPSA